MSEADVGRPSPLRLAVEDREKAAEITGELIAVHVYRELQRANDQLRVAGCAIIGNCSNGSCNIIGNCSSSSKDAVLKKLQQTGVMSMEGGDIVAVLSRFVPPSETRDKAANFLLSFIADQVSREVDRAKERVRVDRGAPPPA